MIAREWIETHCTEFAEGKLSMGGYVGVSLATEGYKLAECGVIGVCLVDSAGAEKYALIEGRDIVKTVEYTELAPEMYGREAGSALKACDLIADFCKNKYLLMHSGHKFGNAFLNKLISGTPGALAVEWPYVDTLLLTRQIYSNVYENGPEKMNVVMAKLAKLAPRGSGGEGLEQLFELYTGKSVADTYRGKPKWMRNAHAVKDLYAAQLTATLLN
jgi:hypothetical protein